MSTLEYHVLLALATGPLHGYAIKDAVEEESAGSLAPRAGSLYRVLARLRTSGLVREVETPSGEPAHPGHARRYYALSAAGKRALHHEALRLKSTALVAERRLGMTPRST